jgi:serine/threonine protein kinase
MSSEDPVALAAKARVNTLLNAKWTIDSVLGTGGMATVFAATHRNGSRAALKVLLAELAQERGLKERFLREGKIANRVDHPARVVVTDDDVSDLGEPFLVMELLVGSTLGQARKQHGGRLSVEETFRVFDVVLDLLAKCHELGIIHRDIKPGNIFLTSADGPQNGAVRVLDFGVARMRDGGGDVDATRAGTALGTPSFMAPEQALGHDGIDGRADLWSVGACIYNCLTGTRLHVGANSTESYLKAATQAAPSIAHAMPELPVEMVAFVDRALAFDRARRYPDAKTMRGELRDLLSAFRSGRLSLGEAKQATGVVMRGDAQQAQSEEPAELVQKRLSAIWKTIGSAMLAVRQYGWVHPTTTKALQSAFDALSANPNSVRWEVAAGAFLYEGEPVWAPDRAPFDRIPYELFADGIRFIELKSGIELQELSDFVAIIMRDPSQVSVEDDSVTALWDRRFQHIAYVAIDSFSLGDDSDDDGFADECAKIADDALTKSQLDKDWNEQSLEARSVERSLLSRMPSRQVVRQAAAELALDPLMRSTMSAQVSQSADAWLTRYVDGFVSAYREGVSGQDLHLLTDALKEWTHDQIVLHAFGPTFETYDAICGAFARVAEPAVAKAVERKLAIIMFPAEELGPILTELARGSIGLDDVIAVGIARALDLLGSDALFGLACECFEGSTDARLRSVLLDYLRRWIRGHESELVPTLGRALPETATSLLQMVAAAKTDQGWQAIEGAFASPHMEVRIAALALLPDTQAERVRAEVSKLLDDKDAGVREKALAVISRSGLAPAGPVLTVRIQQPAFHSLHLDEQRRWFDAVVQLNERRAEALAIELVEQRRVLAKKSVDATRVLAAEVLGKIGTVAALKVLETAAKDRWFNSATVREAAAHQVKAVHARLELATKGAKA